MGSLFISYIKSSQTDPILFLVLLFHASGHATSIFSEYLRFHVFFDHAKPIS